MSAVIDWSSVLKVGLSDWLRIGFILFAAAVHNRGSIARDLLLDGSKLGLAYGSLQPKDVVDVVDLWFARPIDFLVEETRNATQGTSSLWGYNALFEHPLALLGDGSYLVPSPRAVLTRIGPQGLYFIGRDATDPNSNGHKFEKFTSLLGERFEQYIGEQLKLIRCAEVRPEIVYEDSNKSVDFFIETPEVIVLVEAKSAAPNAATRSGTFPDEGDIQSRLQNACTQIGRSANLIRHRHPAFPKLNDRRLRGLIVTREQYFNLVLPTMADLVKPQNVPTTIISSQQLERALAALSDDPTVGATLLQALGNHTQQIQYRLNEIPEGANSILEMAYREWNPFTDRSER